MEEDRTGEICNNAHIMRHVPAQKYQFRVPKCATATVLRIFWGWPVFPLPSRSPARLQ